MAVHELPAEHSVRSLVVHTAIHTNRLLLRWVRDPVTLAQSTLFPALMLVMLNIVLGRQVSAFAGHDALHMTVPMTAIVGVMTGSVVSAVALGRERRTGLLARFWVLPCHRASGLVSRILADAARILLCTIVIVGTGCAIGFRFDNGIGPTVCYFVVPLLFGLAFTTAVTAIAVFTAKAALVEGISLGTSLLMFFSTGFVPLQAYPQWARPVVEQQPMSKAIDAMMGLSLGGPVRGPMIAVIAWSLSIIAIFAVPAAIGYRRASRR
ncbi:ABC transporter permease [Antrihabitans stalactiti]|uniref:Transport permease protein n=1 Tax=Antrihabitans stalactiti TaxID=2584121 RepID=A0A848KIZ3_9NOCA|nr:ABC transporter permease [Antrihabitans stalactiti]NMN98111.1 peptide ABC transporter permease [Antrihabitans stalactiti]